MSFNQTPNAERIRIGFFGMRNAGKSSLVNSLTNQPISLVSDVPGTTTDPVHQAMELLPLGPVLIIDTPGLDDDQENLGALRVKRAKEILSTIHIAVLVVDSARGMCQQDIALEQELRTRQLPYVIVYNKVDQNPQPIVHTSDHPGIRVSALTGDGISELKHQLGLFSEKLRTNKVVISDLLVAGDVVILVVPLDESAPKGRLILPQQMVLRDILDAHATAITCQVEQLPDVLAICHHPRMVVTDSQAFKQVAKLVPTEIPLTSFSILMARYKGDLESLVRGAVALTHLSHDDPILICEGCTHHRQCNDIGTVKLPSWIEKFSGIKPSFSFTSGADFPEDLTSYRLIVHCGGCMLSDREMHRRLECAQQAGIPIVNYGVAIAQMNGILKRSLSLFPSVLSLLE